MENIKGVTISENEMDFPAAVIVHWPSGPVAACVAHAEKLVGMGKFLGYHVGVTPCTTLTECSNCVNERK